MNQQHCSCNHHSVNKTVDVSKPKDRAGVTGPDNDQDQTTTTLFGRSLVLKFQDQTTTT